MTHNDSGSIYLAGICSFLFFITIAMIIGWSSMVRAQEDEGPAPGGKIPPFMLMLTVHTPGRQPDQHRNMPMKSLEDCWEQAHTFMENTEVPEGMVGISAACGKSASHEQKS